MEEAKFDAAKEVSGALEASAALPGQNPGILTAPVTLAGRGPPRHVSRQAGVQTRPCLGQL